MKIEFYRWGFAITSEKVKDNRVVKGNYIYIGHHPIYSKGVKLFKIQATWLDGPHVNIHLSPLFMFSTSWTKLAMWLYKKEEEKYLTEGK